MPKTLFSRKPKQLDVEQYLAKLLERGLSPDGKEIPDSVPIAPPVGYKKQPSMVEIVRDMVRGEKLRQAAIESGHETFEESEDFEIGDDPEDLRSGFENDFDPPLGEIAKEVEKNRPAPPPAASSAAPPASPGTPPPDGPSKSPAAP